MSVTRFYLDTEFDENGVTIELISIGMVCENGKEFYKISSEFHPYLCNDWVKQNVLTQLNGPRVKRAAIRKDLLKFVKENTKPGTKPEFWGYYADYDWVVICQLFGTMIKLPKAFPKFCMDLKQAAGERRLPEQRDGEHHALSDARWVRACVETIKEEQRRRDLANEDNRGPRFF